jgi:hypothetical protein
MAFAVHVPPPVRGGVICLYPENLSAELIDVEADLAKSAVGLKSGVGLKRIRRNND